MQGKEGIIVLRSGWLGQQDVPGQGPPHRGPVRFPTAATYPNLRTALEGVKNEDRTYAFSPEASPSGAKYR